MRLGQDVGNGSVTSSVARCRHCPTHLKKNKWLYENKVLVQI